MPTGARWEEGEPGVQLKPWGQLMALAQILQPQFLQAVVSVMASLTWL